MCFPLVCIFTVFCRKPLMSYQAPVIFDSKFISTDMKHPTLCLLLPLLFRSARGESTSKSLATIAMSKGDISVAQVAQTLNSF